MSSTTSSATLDGDVYDVVVIGAGVSAIPCVEQLLKSGAKVKVFDKGGFNRDPSIPHDIVSGIMGAGAYSDSKFSFFPAGTAVWELEKKDQILAGLEHCIDGINDACTKDKLIKKQGNELLKPLLNKAALLGDVKAHYAAKAKHAPVDSVLKPTRDEAWKLKPYPTVYMPTDARFELMASATELLRECAEMNTVVHKVTQSQQTGHYEISYQTNGHFHETLFVQTRAIVCAGGRFQSLFLQLPKTCERIFRRIELGVRIEGPATNPAWAEMKGTDPKYISTTVDGKTQWRSFCCCRDGETALGSYNGLYSYSGRADCPPTGKSNTGFNLRVYDETRFDEFKKIVQIMRYRKPSEQPFRMSLKNFRALLQQGAGCSSEQEARMLEGFGSFKREMEQGLEEFMRLFPTLATDDDVMVYGPTLEGVGEYWRLDSNLRIPGHNIWVPGDASGTSRGLVPAFVGGHYVGAEVVRFLELSKQDAVGGKPALSNALTAVPRGTIHNKITDDVAYSHTYPRLTGKHGTQALQEVHIFLAPINPPQELVDRYIKLCEAWNADHQHLPNHKPMKCPFLALEFRKYDDDGKFIGFEEVRVMQSARYIASNDQQYVVEQCHADAAYFASHGFDVVREKIEASCYGIHGVPQDSTEMALYPSKYFEFHLKVEKKGIGEDGNPLPVGDEELKQLSQISVKFTEQFGVPVPLSYNVTKSLNGTFQRFLNLRFRSIGAPEALSKVQEVKDAVRDQTAFKISKNIAEFVLYDTMTSLDKNWIE